MTFEMQAVNPGSFGPDHWVSVDAADTIAAAFAAGESVVLHLQDETRNAYVRMKDYTPDHEGTDADGLFEVFTPNSGIKGWNGTMYYDVAGYGEVDSNGKLTISTTQEPV